MTNMSIQPLWLTYFIEILLVLEFQLTKLILARFLIRPILDPKFPLMNVKNEYMGNVNVRIQCGNGGMLGVNVLIGAMLGVNVGMGEC